MARGTDPIYLLARLERGGHADLAIQVRAGTKSAHAAGIIRKPVRLTAFEQVVRRLPRLSAAERGELLRLLAQGLAAPG